MLETLNKRLLEKRIFSWCQNITLKNTITKGRKMTFTMERSVSYNLNRTIIINNETIQNCVSSDMIQYKAYKIIHEMLFQKTFNLNLIRPIDFPFKGNANKENKSSIQTDQGQMSSNLDSSKSHDREKKPSGYEEVSSRLKETHRKYEP